MNLNSNRYPIVRPAGRLSRRKIRGGGYVIAGYPAEAYNYLEPELDLNKYIIRNKRHNLCVWATGPQMLGEGIFYGDMLVVDESVKWKPDSIGLFRIDDELSLRREIRREDGLELTALDPKIKPYFVDQDERMERIGIVTHVVKRFSNYRNNYAGLPENVETLIERGMDYTKYLIPRGHEDDIIYLWAYGESMTGDGIFPGDLLITDNTVEAHEDSIMIFVVDGQFTLKRVVYRDGYNELVSSNPSMPPIRIRKGDELQRWSVLTGTIRNVYDKNEYEIFHAF